MDWATFGDREQKFVAAIEAGNPPDLAEMNIYGPDALQGGPPRRVARSPRTSRPPRAGCCPSPSAATNVGRAGPRRSRGYSIDDGVLPPQGHPGGQGPRSRPSSTTPTWSSSRGRRPGPGQGPLGVRPDPEPVGRRQRVHDQHPAGTTAEGVWDKEGKPALEHDLPGSRTSSRPPVRGGHDPEAQDPAAGRDGLDGRARTTRPTWPASSMSTNNGASLYYGHGEPQARARCREDPGACRRRAARPGRSSARPAPTTWAIFQQEPARRAAPRTSSAGSRTRSGSRST